MNLPVATAIQCSVYFKSGICRINKTLLDRASEVFVKNHFQWFLALLNDKLAISKLYSTVNYDRM